MQKGKNMLVNVDIKTEDKMKMLTAVTKFQLSRTTARHIDARNTQ